MTGTPRNNTPLRKTHPHEIYWFTDAAIVTALAAWGMAHPDPVMKSTPVELRDARLAEMVLDDFDSQGVTVRGEKFGYIALLQPEVIQHIQDAEQAKALLGLVLCHVVRNDSSWREKRIVKGTRDRESIDVPIRGALWLGDLRARAWVPVKGEDAKPQKLVAESGTLKPLLDATWLERNDDAIAFLAECFDFDELDLRLLGIGPEVQERVRRGLVRLLEAGGSDPAFYEALAQEVEIRQRRKRDVERCRRMGFAVQDAVRQALEALGMTVRLVDRGFDYEVSALEDAAMRFGVGRYLLEVKATTTGSARLTPMQAETAANTASRYILCVVDLRGVPEEQLDQDWDGDSITLLASVLTDIGNRVLDTCVLIHRARDSEVGIRNEAALRYEVPPETWMTGISISDWVTSISNRKLSEVL
jgi:hypothetical protein